MINVFITKILAIPCRDNRFLVKVSNRNMEKPAGQNKQIQKSTCFILQYKIQSGFAK